jgi:UDP-N-acetylmuramoylalanine--D-glutamate ligase
VTTVSLPELEDRNVVVYGLGKSGLSALRLLQRQGARVSAVDARADADVGGVPVVAEADALPVLRGADLVVVSPGVPLSTPALVEAARGVEVVGEVELAFRHLRPAPLFGITGTNGKSTTTALLGALFEAAGRRAFVGGNLGQPLSEAALSDVPWEAYVVELSSFQLEGASTLRCDGAALLNLTPDHLDRYASHAAYGAAKARILRNQRPTDAAVFNADDKEICRLVQGAVGRKLAFTLRAGVPSAPHEGLAVADGAGFTFGSERYAVRNRALRGAHNLQNAMAATLLARHGGLPPEAIQRGLDAYPGLPHRLESVGTVRGVEWVNDSKATNVESAEVALAAFERGVWLLAGGKGKGAPYAPLVAAARGKVKGVLTIGADGPAVAQAFEGALPVHPCGTLEAAVKRAQGLATPGDVVLLSPACASYDQFKNFEHRGDVFRALVREL